MVTKMAVSKTVISVVEPTPFGKQSKLFTNNFLQGFFDLWLSVSRCY